MGASRTSNKDICDKLDKLIEVMTSTALNEAPASTTEQTPKESDIKVDKEYLAHVKTRAQDHATAKGCEVVLYARRNKAQETKLAYALRDRYDEVISGQPSHIGPVATFQA